MSHPPSHGEAGRTPSRSRLKVGVGELAVARGDETITTSGLGSCVAVAVGDPDGDVRGLLHAMLPTADSESPNDLRPGKYADAGLRTLVDDLADAGADPSRLEARVVGGAEMLDIAASVGPRNVDAARATLAELGVEVVAADVGGNVGRTVRYHPDGELAIRAADGFERRL